MATTARISGCDRGWPMAPKRRSLGRGLEALLGTDAIAPQPDTREGLRELPTDLLQRGRHQPRVDMREESLRELADSIRAQGLVQPIVVRRLNAPQGGGETRYEIVAGERRWRAAQLAGLDSITALVRDMSDREAVAVGLIENMQREDLNPLEEAGALRRLVDEFEMTHAEAADAVGRSRASVTNLMRLLELPGEVKEMVEAGTLNMGHARALLALEDRVALVALARRAVRQGWSVRETERAVNRLARAPKEPTPAPTKDPDVLRLETELSDRLGAEVQIDQRAKGGRVVIRYHGVDELEGIIERLGHRSLS